MIRFLFVQQFFGPNEAEQLALTFSKVNLISRFFFSYLNSRRQRDIGSGIYLSIIISHQQKIELYMAIGNIYHNVYML